MLAGLATAGLVLLALGHAGLDVPVLSALGPGGDRAVPQAAGAFAVGAVLWGAVAAGLAAQRRWAWAIAILLALLGIAGGVAQFRGAASAGGIVLSAVLAGLLLLPRVRGSLR